MPEGNLLAVVDPLRTESASPTASPKTARRFGETRVDGRIGTFSVSAAFVPIPDLRTRIKLPCIKLR